MTRPAALLLTVSLFAIPSLGCESSSPRTIDAESEATVYGQLHEPSSELVSLMRIAAEPTIYLGRQVRTEGEIQRVCQKRGCWLELAGADGTRAFVPMAGHAFAVPKESVGSEALVEGTVRVRERSQAERQHLEADGAGKSIPALSIEANAVVIR